MAASLKEESGILGQTAISFRSPERKSCQCGRKAREKNFLLRQQLDQGINPALECKKEKGLIEEAIQEEKRIAKGEAHPLSVEAVALDWLEDIRKNWKKNTYLGEYLATAEGTQALLFFQNFPKFVADGDPGNNIAKFVDALLLTPLAEDVFNVKRDISSDGLKPVIYSDFEDFAEDVTSFLHEQASRPGINYRNLVEDMPLRMGRGIRYYPDYVIHADTTRGDERGTVICEAKFRIPNKNQLREDFYQAKSYASRLGCQGLILASCEGIWLSFAQDSYNFEKLQFIAWDALSHPDTLHTVKIKFDKLFKKKHAQ